MVWLCLPQSIAPMVVLQWDAWAPGGAPAGLKTVDFFAPTIEPDAGAPEGACSAVGLHATTVGPWGLTVAAHGKANDDHVRLVGACTLGPRAGAITRASPCAACDALSFCMPMAPCASNWMLACRHESI